MDVDQNARGPEHALPLSQVELSKLNEAMNKFSEKEKLGNIIHYADEFAEAGEYTWNYLSSSVVAFLSAELSKITSKAQLFSIYSSADEVTSFAQNLKVDELKAWKEGLRTGVLEGNWGKLAAHRTSSIVAVYPT